MAFGISQDFDSGSYDAANTSLSEGTLTLRPQVDVNSAWGWFAVRLDDALGESVNVIVNTANRATGNDADLHYLWLATALDTDEQTPVAVTYAANQVSVSLGPFSDNTVYLSHAPLYPFARTVSKLAEWANHDDFHEAFGCPDFVAGTLTERTNFAGRTIPGHPIYAASITDLSVTSAKKNILITAGNHPGESYARWNFEALVEWILSEDAEAVALRQAAIIHILPNINPQGVAGGYYRSSPQAATTDYNRIWGAGNTQETVQIIEPLLRRLGPFDAHLDMHNRNNHIPQSQLYRNTVRKAMTPFETALQSKHTVTLTDFNQGGTLDRFVASISPRMTLSAAPEESGDSGKGMSDYAAYGEALAQSMAEVVAAGELTDETSTVAPSIYTPMQRGVFGRMLALEPVALYSFDNAEPGPLVDLSGNGRTGIYAGGVTYGVATSMARMRKSAVTLDEGYGQVDNHADFVGFGDWTVILRVAVEAWPTGNAIRYIAGVWDTASNRSWAIAAFGPEASGAPDSVTMVASSTGTNTVILDDAKILKSSVTEGASRTIAFRRSGSTVASFLDGEKIGEHTPGSGALYASTAPLRFGSNSNADPGSFVSITLDGAAIYRAALTDAQLLAIHEQIERGHTGTRLAIRKTA